MTVQQVQQLDREHFLEYIYQLKAIAEEKFSFDIFIQNKQSKTDKLEKEDKRDLKHLGALDLGGMFDDINVREYAYE